MLDKRQFQTWLRQNQLSDHSLATITEGTGYAYKTISGSVRKNKVDEFFVLAVAHKYEVGVLATAAQLPAFTDISLENPLDPQALLLALDHRYLVDHLSDGATAASPTDRSVKPQKELLRRIWEHYELHTQIKALTAQSKLSRDSLYRQFRNEVSPRLTAAACNVGSVNLRLFFLGRGLLSLSEAMHPADPATVLDEMNPRSIVNELKESASMFHERFAPNFDPEEDAGL